jgi:hypothetical protein
MDAAISFMYIILHTLFLLEDKEILPEPRKKIKPS